MGRTAKGVRGMRVSFASSVLEVEETDIIENDESDDGDDVAELNVISRIVSLVVVPETGEVLCACANGYGKRTPVGDFPTKKRGGKGVIAIKTSDRNGELVGAVSIDESKELMLISDGGTLVRTRASEVATTGRNAQGVRLIRLSEAETLVGVVSIEAVEVDDDEVLDVLEDAVNTSPDTTTSDEISSESKDDAIEE